MKFIATFALVLFAFAAQSQVLVDDVDINKLEHVQYVELVGQQKFLSMKSVVNVDFGQAFKLFKPQKVQDMNGKNMAFNSMVDALNFMEANGWEFVNNYAVQTTDASIFHYLLRRKADK